MKSGHWSHCNVIRMTILGGAVLISHTENKNTCTGKSIYFNFINYFIVLYYFHFILTKTVSAVFFFW